MTPFLEAGDPSQVTWTHLWVAVAVLNVYIGAGIGWAFHVKRKRDARLGPGRVGDAEGRRSRRGLSRFLDEVYALSSLSGRVAAALRRLRTRPAARPTPAGEDHASAT